MGFLEQRTLRLLASLALLLVLPTVGHALQQDAKSRVEEDQLVLDLVEERWLRLVLPSSILEDELVANELTSGLTTTFLFTVNPRGGAPDGHAQVQVRYHLWDEAFHCQTNGLGGQSDVRILSSREALHQWWQGLRLQALDLRLQAAGDSPPRQVKVTLDVIPFSGLEQEDTRRWLGEALGREGRSPSDVGPQAGPGGAIGQVFNVLIATSIRRRAVTSYRWTLAVPEGAFP